MSESSSFKPPERYIYQFSLHPNRKSPWFIHRLHLRHFQTKYSWRVTCRTDWRRYLLDDNIHRFCLLVIERLWCFPPVLQHLALPLCCAEIYWPIDCLTPPLCAEARETSRSASLHIPPAVNWHFSVSDLLKMSDQRSGVILSYTPASFFTTIIINIFYETLDCSKDTSTATRALQATWCKNITQVETSPA